MNDFNELCRTQALYYRGSSRKLARAIMSLAVGPVRAVAMFIRDNRHDVPPPEREAAYTFFQRAVTMPGGPLNVAGAPSGTPYVAAPAATLAARLATLLSIPGLSWNPFTVFEHVLYEPEAQINLPRTSRLLESVTSDPRTAILYAHGIQPDPWWDRQEIVFQDNRPPNSDAFVAVLPESKCVDAKSMLGRIQNVATPNGLTPQEAERRVKRDSESLLATAVPPRTIINLPSFDVSNPNGALAAAASTLVNAGVAGWGGATCP